MAVTPAAAESPLAGSGGGAPTIAMTFSAADLVHYGRRPSAGSGDSSFSGGATPAAVPLVGSRGSLSPRGLPTECLDSPSDQATIIENSSAAGEGAAGSGSFHGHGLPRDPRKALGIGGLSFAPLYNETENAHRETESAWTFGLVSSGLHALTGAVTGLLACTTSSLSQRLGSLRLEATLRYAAEGQWVQAWLASCAFMLLFALGGALPVILGTKSTGGSSGIPSIIGILNGCDLRHEFTLRILLVRFVGVTLAVASGLAVGPEGPMIFIGAAVGALMSEVASWPKVWRCCGRPPVSLNRHVYLRDYISTGAACGIAAAFRAPIAGTLFVIEEAASHFRRNHLAKMFVGCLIATEFTALLFNLGSDEIIEYRVPTDSGCGVQHWFQPFTFIFVISIGVVCGLAGALFNHVNVRMALLRARFASDRRPFRRALEVACVCVITSTCWVGMSFLVSEAPAGDSHIFSHSEFCVRGAWQQQIIQGARVEDGGLKYQPQPCLYGVQYDPRLCPQAWALASRGGAGSAQAQACTWRVVRGTGIAGRADNTSYCCHFRDIAELARGNFQVPGNTSCPFRLGDSFPGVAGHPRRECSGANCGGGHYNPMAALTLVPFEDVAQNLFARGAPYIIPVHVLLSFLPVFFLLAAVTAGSALPSGTLLPMIVLGATIGRLMAVGLIQLKLSMGWYASETPGTSSWSSEWQPFFAYAGGPLPESAPFATAGWVDPGAAALVGVGAMLGGCARTSLVVTVMMVEITGDPMIIVPVGAATLVAVYIGNCLNHGIYHSLVDVASFPFLPDVWPKDIPKSLRVEHLFMLEDASQFVVCVSLAAQRSDVEAALRGNTYTGFPVLNADGVSVGVVMRPHLEELLGSMSDTVDIGRVVDFNHVTVRANLPLAVAYDLFKRMEVSHMVVVDDDHHPVAVLTRKSLLPWRIKQRFGHNNSLVRHTIQRPRSFRRVPSVMFHSNDDILI